MLTRYERLGASSRLRSYQYIPILKKAGFEVSVSHLFSDQYIRGLQSGRRDAQEVIAAYVRRISALLRSSVYDLLWVEKECLPWLPAGLEQSLSSPRVPFVLDYDDAVFHYYDRHQSAIVRRLLGNKHRRLIRRATLVVAGNAYLGDFARRAGARRVKILPTVIDLERYNLTPHFQASSKSSEVGVVWIGQRSTAKFLEPLKTVFSNLVRSESVHFAAIGINAGARGFPMKSIDWSEQTEVESIKQFDIGVMPLEDGPFERGKCGYKLIQYMACGLPVVASPVGVNKQIVEHGVNGFLAESTEEWSNALRTLIRDEGLRRNMGKAGRDKVEREYCIQVTGPRLVQLLNSAARG
jgi:glycosyltransferase involved in cell wall biosynthesis